MANNTDEFPRYFATGPEGYFYADDLAFARKLCNLIDPAGDDWTIMDKTKPAIKGWPPEGTNERS